MDTDRPLSRAERRMKKKPTIAPGKPPAGSAEMSRRQNQARHEEKRAESKSLRWQRKR